jgi:C4-dicarboxylate-specific signal transduction histidine kinase
MHSLLEGSQLTATVALRILGGEKQSDIKTPPTRFATAKYDWRELQRWRINESRLPPGSEIHFRSPTAWEQYRSEILAVFAVLLLQTMLISWLMYERRHRRLAEISARNTLSELTYVNRLATAGELSASIAHEMNQPLTAITTRIAAAKNWLKATPPNTEEASAALTTMQDAAFRAANIVTNLRAMFKKDAQDKGPVEINRVILAVLELVRMEVQKHDVEMQIQLSDTVPIVTGQEIQLQQVVLNLVMNAIEAMDSVPLGQRRLRVKTELRESVGVKVSIEDTGKGIEPSDFAHVFRPMFTTKARGMGMGLSICRSIIEGHNGRIWVAAGTPRGSIFQIVLPTAR